MTTETFLALLAIASITASIGVIIYDRIRYRKYYEQKGKFTFIRINNPDVRKQIKDAGIPLCPCAREFRNSYLYTQDGTIVCGFSENNQHLIADAVKNNMKVIDCGINVYKFIREVKDYDKVDD